MCLEILYQIYMYKKDLALNNIQRLIYHKTKPNQSNPNQGGCPRGVVVKAMGCGIVVSEFVLQSRYYVHFRTNTLGKDMNPLILPAMG